MKKSLFYNVKSNLFSLKNIKHKKQKNYKIKK